MKFFAVIALIVAVASADFNKPAPSNDLAQVQQIIAAIQSPSTDPATAILLEQMLMETLGIGSSPISVGPAIIDQTPEAVQLPAPVIVEPVLPAEPSLPAEPAQPVEAAQPADSSSAPLVQIILNINQAATEAGSPAIVAPAPVLLPAAPEIVSVVEASPEPVSVVEAAPESVVGVAPEPISVITPVIVAPEAAPGIVVGVAPEPISVITPVVVAPEAAPGIVVGVAPEPISVITPVVVNPEPISVGTPVLPAPAVVLPEILN